MGPRASTSPQWQTLLSLLGFIYALHLAAPVLAYVELSDAALRNVPSGADVLNPHTGSLLSPILVPRVPGTPGSAAAQRHMVDFFARELPQWRLEWQNSTSRTPATGTAEIPFSNLVFTRDPPWAKGNGDVGRLALVAHYDSLYQPEGFIGATDSAAPCAILMQVARGIDAALSKKWEAMEESGDAGLGLEDDEKGVQILLLDGEEAWVTWSDTDSLYGARYVCRYHEKAGMPYNCESEGSSVLQVSRREVGGRNVPRAIDIRDSARRHQPLRPARSAGSGGSARAVVFRRDTLGVPKHGED